MGKFDEIIDRIKKEYDAAPKTKAVTAIDLYKFIHDNGMEYRWYEDDKVYLLVPTYEIEDFNKLLRAGIDDEDGEKCFMQEHWFCFPEMVSFCENNEIDPKEVFNPKGSHH